MSQKRPCTSPRAKRPLSRLTGWLLALLPVVAMAGGGGVPGAKGLVRSSQASGPQHGVRALVVGVSDFKHLGAEDDLAFAEADARWFAETLKSVVRTDHLELLVGADATQARIDGALTELLTGAREDEVVLIYLASHGAKVGREGFLIAQDSQVESRLSATGVSFKSLASRVGASKARQVITFADLVHQPVKGTQSAKTGPGVGIDTLFGETLSRRESSFVMLSARGSQSSGGGSAACGGHGAFACALTQALSGSADRDADGLVALGELAVALSQATHFATGAAQTPTSMGVYDADLAFTVNSTIAQDLKVTTWEDKVVDRLQVCLEANGAPVPAGHLYKSGDTFAMTVTAPLTGHLNVVNTGPDGAKNHLFPIGSETSAVSTGATVRVPSNLLDPITFDAVAGDEQVTLLWTRAPLTAAAALDLTRTAPSSIAQIGGGGAKGMGRVSQAHDVGDQRCSEYRLEQSGEVLRVDLTLKHR
jgi:hypothetical protein